MISNAILYNIFIDKKLYTLNYYIMEKFEIQSKVRSSETDCLYELRIKSLFDMMQDTIMLYLTSTGKDISWWQKQGMGWVAKKYYVKIFSFPVVFTTYQIRTWISSFDRSGCTIEFQLLNNKNIPFALASSKWLLLKLTEIGDGTCKKEVLNPLNTFPDMVDFVINERAVETTFPKVKCLAGDMTNYYRKWEVQRDYLDFNNHVNNARYPLWATELVPLDFRKKHMPDIMNIVFMNEATENNWLYNTARFSSENESRHSILAKRKDDASNPKIELARIEISWKKLPGIA